MILLNVIKTPATFSSQHLQLPGTNNKHPLYPKLKASFIHFIEHHIRTQDTPSQQKKLFSPHGEHQLKTDTKQYTKHGKNFVVRETLITFKQLYMMLSLSFHCHTTRVKVIGLSVMPGVL